MNQSSLPHSGVLDPAVMESLRSLGAPGEPDVYAELAQLFIDDVSARLPELDAAVAANSTEAVMQVAHRLRGGSLEIGALRMAPICAAIEHAARAGSLVHAEPMTEILKREFAATRLALEQAIQV